MARLDALLLIAYYLALGILAIYSIHRLYLVRLRRTHDVPHLPIGAPVVWPSVTVQLPLFNEPNVAARLIDAVAAIDYAGPLAVQVLDDSDDVTTAIVSERVAFWRTQGVDITHHRRGTRNGYKAGALAYGLAHSDSRLFAVFDADFVPPRDILTKMVPHFGDVWSAEQHVRAEDGTDNPIDPRDGSERDGAVGAAGVGMVQARWTHLNREQSLLTRVQAIYLDAHFAVESAARNFGGRFFNFNGTAGIWRREAIDAAGGWSASTLTEDLDLSYRAQLAGWKFVFLPDVEVPAELPAALSGFQEQQHRWAKGSIQTARKLLPRILGGNLPARVKSEAFFHLTNNSAYLLTLVLALLIVPAIVVRQRLGLLWTMSIDVVLFFTSTGSVLRFYLEGQRRAGRRRPTVRELLAVIPIGIGISIRNSAAVVEGLFEHGGHFRRTPKSGDLGRAVLERPPRIPIAELVLGVFFLAAFAAFASARQWIALPFLMLFTGGFVYVAVAALLERLTFQTRM
jgi:cellulose synthase/poly-beta-1,6-N-acetylglucosamine synthase-like glycosyltransferase